MPPFHGWMYMVDANGVLHEVVNQARTADYLRNVGLGSAAGSFCDIKEDGGCAAYRWRPPCGPEEESNPSSVIWPSGATERNSLSIPDNAAFSAPTQIDIRFAVRGIASGSGVRTIAAHRDNGGSNIAFSAQLSSTDILQFVTTTNGSTQVTATCDVAFTTNDDLVLGRITWRSSDGRVQFFRKLGIDDDEIVANFDSDFGWTQIGADETASAAALFNSTAPLAIGNVHASTAAVGNPFIGTMHALSLATTIDGVPIFRWVPGDIGGPLVSTFHASTGQVVTVTRAASGAQLSIYVDAFEGWDLEFYSAPDTDPAPWYSASRPESADALGFWITEWTGLDNGHVTRPSFPHGGAGGGSFHGPLTATGRTMAVRLILFARSERAMQYLFDWLGTTLYSACNPCSGDSMLIRRFCMDPDSEGSPWQGVAKLNNVDIMSGPLWEVEPQLRNQCLIRGASVVFEAGDPCMYLPGTAIDWDGVEPELATCLSDLAATPNLVPCRPSCLDLNASDDCRWTTSFEVELAEAAVAPVLTLDNLTTEYSVPCRIQFLADPLDLGLGSICNLQRIGQLYVRALRPGAQVVWDVSAREIYYRDHMTAGLINGQAAIDANDPPLRRSFVLPCGTIHVVIEVASRCLEEVTAGVWSDGEHTFEDPRLPSPSLEIAYRVGCP